MERSDSDVYASRVHEWVAHLETQVAGRSQGHKDLSRMLTGMIRDAQKFHVGDFQAFFFATEHLMPTSEALAPPFPTTIIETTTSSGGGRHIACLLSQIPDGRYNLVVGVKVEGVTGWATSKPVTIEPIEGGEVEIQTETAISNEELGYYIALFARMQAALTHRDSIDMAERDVPARATVASRMGKTPPIYSHKTLVIAPKVTPSGERKGGTHASPRVHLRRGHYRRRGGKTIWVKPTTVGDKSRGMVTKDYVVETTTERKHP